MPIITKAGSPVKGSPIQFTLDKTALAAIVTDAYYADEDNWKEVVLNYKSSTGKQKEIIKFDATLALPISNFKTSVKSLDDFEIHNIIIKDFDNGSFKIPRSALTSPEIEFDVYLTTSGEPQFLLLEDSDELLFEDGTNALLN
jgi:hypothetical protein